MSCFFSLSFMLIENIRLTMERFGAGIFCFSMTENFREHLNMEILMRKFKISTRFTAKTDNTAKRYIDKLLSLN